MKNIFEAVCKNKIASVRLILESPLDHVTEVHREGEKKFLFTKYKEDTIVYKEKTYTFHNLCKFLGPIELYITDKNEVWCAPQVIIQYQTSPWSGGIECKRFSTDQEARDYYFKLIVENSLEQI